MTPRPGVRFRVARRDDLQTIVEMMAAFERLLAAIDGSESTFDPDKALRRLQDFGFGERPLFTAALAEVDGKLIGYAIYSLAFWADSQEGILFLTDIFMREEWRSRGLGRELMDHLAGVAKAAGCTRMLWTVWDKNPRAQRFYESLGASVMGDERLMSWTLDGK
ncbi:MAG: GNAT family N-acetyltransferase [Rhodospirillales bacterium]|nr:GNAT family N-acetyltransferase [Rhodospirillales bacterium]